NTFSSIGAFLLGASTLPFFYNVWKTAKYAPRVSVDDPWGYGRSLEWATSCPPPRHNFVTLPRVRSEGPAFDLHHPEIAAHDPGKHGKRDILDEPGAATHEGPDAGRSV
ncbi:cytochrome ubiquinol oxidase subunit I, partial [Streptomyces sp. NPDC058674]